MKCDKISICFLMLAALLMISCDGGTKTGGPSKTSQFLVDKFADLNLARSSDVQTFIGDALYEHIDGGAELYHLYNFEEVATAYYSRDDFEIMADIYKFKNSNDAYGLFTTLRPPEANIARIGVETILTQTSAHLVKGEYMVKLVAYEETPDAASLVKSLTENFERMIPGTTAMPEQFSLLPQRNKVEHSEKIYAGSFLSWQELTDVYTNQYAFAEDTVTLFLTDDAAGEKYLIWSMKVMEAGARKLSPGAFPFDDDYALSTEHNYYGTIIAGLKCGKLIGIIGYKDNYRDFLRMWLNSLQQKL